MKKKFNAPDSNETVGNKSLINILHRKDRSYMDVLYTIWSIFTLRA